MDHVTGGFGTRAIHAAYDANSEHGAIVPPIHISATYTASTVDEIAARIAGSSPGYYYSRMNNPTLDLLSRRIANLEEAEAGLCAASGMGAISSTIWAMLEGGDEIIVDSTLYGCTYGLVTHQLPRFGIRVRHVNLQSIDNLKNAISSKTRLVYFETPANPNMRLIDIAAVSELCRNNGALVLIDNTYSSPYITQPLTLGAHLVMHSATKYLGGHGDLIGGMIVGSQEHIETIRARGLRYMTGASMCPQSANLILRGIKTLNIRMQRHSANAQAIAEYLEDHPAVSSVHYPGLSSFPQHELAKRQMRLFGGIIAFELKGGMSSGKKLIDRLCLIRCAVSLGDCESLIQHPASMTHGAYSPEERQRLAISDGLIRLSVGLEDVEDLIADLNCALNGVE